MDELMNVPFFRSDNPECARCGKPPGPNEDEWQGWQLVASVLPEPPEIFYARDGFDWDLIEYQRSWCWVCEGCLTLEEWMSNQCNSGTE
jgi:hypothetical protein